MQICNLCCNAKLDKVRIGCNKYLLESVAVDLIYDFPTT